MNEKIKRCIKKISATALLLAFMVCVFGLSGRNIMNAKAYYSGGYLSSASVKQVSMDATSITCSWPAVSGAVKYIVSIGADYSTVREVGTTTAPQYTFTNLKNGMQYYVMIQPVDAKGEYSYGSKVMMETLPTTVTNFKQEKWWYFIKKLEVRWDKQPSVDGYEVSLYNSKNKRVKTVTATKYASSASFANMKDEVYTVKIYGYKKWNGKTYKTKTATTTCMNQARIIKCRVSDKKLTVKWNRVGGASGYDIYVSTKKNTGYKKVKTVGSKATSVTISKLKGKSFNAKKPYYIYVQTRIKRGKKTNTSGALYYWNSKNTGFGYLN